ncbi:MAG: S8 family serine peptidase [Cyclobacteriaceae bacterium]
MERSRLIVILFLAISFQLEAGVNRYIVFFIDKANSEFSVNRPEEFLSTKAIQRRERQGLLITESDLPVNSSYITQLADLEADVFHSSKWMNAVLVQVDEAVISDISALSFVKKVQYVAPNEKLLKNAENEESDTQFNKRPRNSKSTAAQNELLSVDEMHELGFDGDNITIAVFDGGFQKVNEISYFEHIFSENRMVATYDFVTNSSNVYRYDDHGTRVFSAISGFFEDSFTGTAPDANFVLCVTEDVGTEFKIEEYNWLFAAEYADSLGVDIISTSLGYNIFDDRTMDYEHDDLDGQTAVITQAANMAAEKGILLVVSAGNEGNNSWGTLTPPADSEFVLTVGSVTSSGDLSSFSSLGPTADDRIKPDVVALGSGVSLIGSSGSIITSNGTSFSAPLVAGLAAGIWQAKPELTNLELIDIIRMTASRASAPDNSFGYGVPDFISATQEQVLSVDDILKERIKVYPNPFRGTKIYIDLNSRFTENGLTISLYDLAGNLLTQGSYQNVPSEKIIEFDTDAVLPVGTYLLQVESPKRQTQVRLLKY